MNQQSSAPWVGTLPKTTLHQITAQGVKQPMRPKPYQITSPCSGIKFISTHISSNFHMHELDIFPCINYGITFCCSFNIFQLLSCGIWNVVFSLFLTPFPLNLCKPMILTLPGHMQKFKYTSYAKIDRNIHLFKALPSLEYEPYHRSQNYFISFLFSQTQKIVVVLQILHPT